MTLLSVDWDAFSGPRELVFDAPIWGTPDRPADRLDAWQGRARRRGGESWAALDADFPLYAGWQALRRYAGVPTFVTLSHADAWGWLRQFPGSDVLNVDSHHDLTSFSGDPARLRPGNWAGLGLAAGLIRHYVCLYPWWHAGLPVAEGHDLQRTWGEFGPRLPPELHGRVTLRRQTDPDDGWPAAHEVKALLLVQSPAWTNPAHDAALTETAQALAAQPLNPPLERSWAHGFGAMGP